MGSNYSHMNLEKERKKERKREKERERQTERKKRKKEKKKKPGRLCNEIKKTNQSHRKPDKLLHHSNEA